MSLYSFYRDGHSYSSEEVYNAMVERGQIRNRITSQKKDQSRKSQIFGKHGPLIVECLKSFCCARVAKIKPTTQDTAVLLRGPTVVFPMGESSLLRCICSWLCLDSVDALAVTSRHWWSLCRQKLPLMIDILIDIELRWCSPTGLRLLLSKKRGDAKRSLYRSVQRTRYHLEILVAAGTATWDSICWQSAAVGHTVGVAIALSKGANVEAPGGRASFYQNDESREGPPLWCCCKFGYPGTVEYLVDVAGANIECIGGRKTKSTPLWVAARENKLDVATFLIHRGASPDAMNRLGFPGRSLHVLYLKTESSTPE